ncbi:DNA-binding transcriptional regulator, XRE-family HTH domain [Ignavigranum ruoffiae]|uniref:DNA-binding transcriptional regulator, XRE-family HTH domain n=1 Tax=Ignavigranum ruoffiae TaxID=89093 RepID=A0A1H9GAN7_9LACT|nr:hypothetical protein [Ignavigranum ruoffiae]SEQ46818.1 DNA-binding transcriptional regulator, XRE-family HTH domain [Ignavigranum ruoffiae]
MNKIARYRKFLGYTQADMAKIFNISIQSYSRKERGIVPFADKEKILFKNMVSKLFEEITIDDIFFGQ